MQRIIASELKVNECMKGLECIGRCRSLAVLLRDPNKPNGVNPSGP